MLAVCGRVCRVTAGFLQGQMLRCSPVDTLRGVVHLEGLCQLPAELQPGCMPCSLLLSPRDQCLGLQDDIRPAPHGAAQGHDELKRTGSQSVAAAWGMATSLCEPHKQACTLS